MPGPSDAEIETEPPDGESEFLSADPNRNLTGLSDDDEVNPGAGSPEDNPARDAERAIVEADIIRLIDDRLYLLNRYRGLQIVDFAEPDEPTLLGASPIVGQPVEMFLRDQVAWIIVSDYLTYWQGGGDSGRFHGTTIRAIDVSDPSQPSELGRLDLDGFVSDTRIVGDILYAVSRLQPTDCGAASSLGDTFVVSLDVSNYGEPREVDRLDFAAAGEHMHVTERAIVTVANDTSPGPATANGSETRVTLVDISDPAGALRLGGDLTLEGRVDSEEQIDVADDWLRIVSSDDAIGGEGAAVVHLVDISDLDAPASVATLDIGTRGTLSATRFDGDRLFVVTDGTEPLVAVDLANPEQPTVAGTTEVAGWLRHLEVRGDRMLGFGVSAAEDRQAMVALFDVADLAAVAPLDEATVGSRWSWLDGEWDHQTFQVLEEQGLVLLPYSGVDGESLLQVHGLQLVSWQDDGLEARGGIEHQGQVRRARAYANRVITFGDRELQVIDPTDRDDPVVTATMTLSRDVWRVAEVNGVALTQVGGGRTFGDVVAAESCTAECPVQPRERVEFRLAPLSDPEGERALLSSFTTELLNPTLFMHRDFAYILGELRPQRRGDAGTIELEVWDLDDVRRPALRSTVVLEGMRDFVSKSQPGYAYGLPGNIYAMGALLVFHQPRQLSYGAEYYELEGEYGVRRAALLDELIDSSPTERAQALAAFDEEWRTRLDAAAELDNPHRFHVLDVADPAAPRLMATVDLELELPLFNVRVEGDRLFFQHSVAAEADDSGRARQRFFLDGLDLSDPRSPEVMGPYNVPGQLLDVADDGVTIYTQDLHYISEDSDTVTSSLNVSLLFDRKAFLQGSLPIEGQVYNLVVSNGVAFATTHDGASGQPTDQAGFPGCQVVPDDAEIVLRTFDLRDEDDLRAAAEVRIESRSGWLRDVAQSRAFLDLDWGSAMLLLDVSDPDVPRLFGFFRTQGYVQDVTIVDGRAYLSSGFYGVHSVDLRGAPLL